MPNGPCTIRTCTTSVAAGLEASVAVTVWTPGAAVEPRVQSFTKQVATPLSGALQPAGPPLPDWMTLVCAELRLPPPARLQFTRVPTGRPCPASSTATPTGRTSWLNPVSARALSEKVWEPWFR